MFKRIFHGFVLLAFVAGLLAVSPAQPARALTLTVTNTNDSGAGSLRHAIDNAVDGDVIDATGISGTIVLSSELVINDDITINGPGADTLTVSGNNSVRVFYINVVATVEINHLTVANGKVIDVSGGGIYNDGSLTLNHVTVTGNQALESVSPYEHGGGIYSPGSLTIHHGLISNNTATYSAGGIYADSTISLTITDTVIDSNQTLNDNGAGGGLRVDGTSTATLTRVTISNNSASDSGGGINSTSSLIITDSVVSNNSTFGSSAGGYGGGLTLSNSGNTFTLTNVTISGNSADNLSNSAGAGGLFLTAGTLNLNNVTVTGNTSEGDAGGIFAHPLSTVNIGNSIISGNTSSSAVTEDCYATLTSKGYNLIQVISACTIGGDTTGNLTGVDPLLGALADNGGPTLTHALLAASPAIDAGDNSTCEGKDQRAIIRPQDGDGDLTDTCDMGAYEFALSPEVVSIVRANLDPTGLAFVDFTVTFSENVSDVDAADFSLVASGVTGASITNVSGANDTYTVTVDTGIGNGALELDMPDTATVYDANLNEMTALPFTSGEVYTVTKVAPNPFTPLNGAVLHTLRPDFDWSNYVAAKGYQIQVSKSLGFGTTLINVTLTGATNSQYTLTKDLPAKTLLYWRVRAKLSATKYSAWSPVFTFTTGNPPSVPGLVSPANSALMTNLNPTLDWSDSTVPAGTTFNEYQVQVDDDADFSSPEAERFLSVVTSSSSVVGPLDVNTKYYWRVRA